MRVYECICSCICVCRRSDLNLFTFVPFLYGALPARRYEPDGAIDFVLTHEPPTPPTGPLPSPLARHPSGSPLPLFSDAPSE